MELQKFTEKTMKALKEYYGAAVEIKNHKIYKNNGILLQGVSVLGQGMNIAPTVYLNDFLERYEAGETFGSLMKNIIDIIEKNKVTNHFDVDFFMDYEQVKKKLVLRLINREKNKELLKRVPYLKYKDLAIVCHCIVVSEEIGNGSILIHKEHLKNWGILEDTLLQDAFENSPRAEAFEIIKISDMVKGMLKEMVREKIDEICEGDSKRREVLLESTLEMMAREMEEKQIPMYVLTNINRYYGAACLVYPDMLEKIGNMLQDDFYVLPSSVHEVIFVGKSGCVDSAALNEMIEEVNRTQVEEEELLSEHAYLYERKSKSFISVTNTGTLLE